MTDEYAKIVERDISYSRERIIPPRQHYEQVEAIFTNLMQETLKLHPDLFGNPSNEFILKLDSNNVKWFLYQQSPAVLKSILTEQQLNFVGHFANQFI